MNLHDNRNSRSSAMATQTDCVIYLEFTQRQPYYSDLLLLLFRLPTKRQAFELRWSHQPGNNGLHAVGRRRRHLGITNGGCNQVLFNLVEGDHSGQTCTQKTIIKRLAIRRAHLLNLSHYKLKCQLTVMPNGIFAFDKRENPPTSKCKKRLRD
jgi:hypothetical protein